MEMCATDRQVRAHKVLISLVPSDVHTVVEIAKPKYMVKRVEHQYLCDTV